MNATLNIAEFPDSRVVSICLLPGADHSTLSSLLDRLYWEGKNEVCLDLCQVPRLGPLEIRTLGRYGESFKQRRGELKLANASKSVATLIHVLEFTDLIRIESQTAETPE